MIQRIKRRYRLWQIERRMDIIEARYIDSGKLTDASEQEFIRLFNEQAELLGEQLDLIEEKQRLNADRRPFYSRTD